VRAALTPTSPHLEELDDKWAWEILDFYDTAFSPDLKRELLIEGTIILSK
jgi:hypothetical protein